MIKTRLTFLAVGQGNGFMLEVFDSWTQSLVGLALFDFGGDSQEYPYVQSSISILYNAMARRAAQKGLPGYYLDFLCITHQDKDHWKYLDYFTKLSGLTIFSACINWKSKSIEFKDMYLKLPVQFPLYNLTAGARYSLFDNPDLGVSYQVLAWGVGQSRSVRYCNADSDGYNTSSIVLKIGGNCPYFVLTGDATAHTMKFILERWSHEVPYSAVMSAPHHGSYTTAKGYYVTRDITGQGQQHDVYKEFFDRLRPNRIVVSAGMHGSYGHPHFTMMKDYNTILSRYGNIDDQHDIWLNQRNDRVQNYILVPVTTRLYTTQMGLDGSWNKIFVHQIIETDAYGEVNHSEVSADTIVDMSPNGIVCIDNLNSSQSQKGLLKEQSRNIRSCRAVAHKVRK